MLSLTHLTDCHEHDTTADTREKVCASSLILPVFDHALMAANGGEELTARMREIELVIKYTDGGS